MEFVMEGAKLAGQQMAYARNHEKKMEELDTEARFLFARRDDVQEKINGGLPNAATSESKLWLDYVKKVERKVKSIREDHEKGPNFISRLDLGKRIGDVMDEITNLNNKRPKLKGEEFSIAPLERVKIQNVEVNSSTAAERPPLERVQLQNVEANSSAAAEHTLQKVLRFVEDDKIRRTGIWGIGGVGKTTVMKLLNNRLKVSQRFEIIIWITVSREGDERKVQNAIAEWLKLNESKSNDELKASIFQTLSRKKFLILLDDVWKFIDLSDVGIPLEHQVNGSKIVLTTRSLDVCRQMKTDEEVKVETLSKDEAWTLFTENVGDVAMTPSIKQFARDIVAECDGLPLAIIVVGSSLRKNSDLVVWRNTLRKLQSPSASQNKDIEERVFRCLRYSYEWLQEYKRKLFLYCSLYPEDYMIKIKELVEYCWLEGYIHGVGSIQDAQDEGHTMVMNLVDASLLEKVQEGYVQMHDIIRDFAMKEASGFLVKTGRHVRQPPMKNEWHVRQPPMENEWLQWEKMSMMDCRLQGLSECWNCSIMSTLLLQGSAELTMISDSFFEKMPSLSILDLSRTNIESLPLSLFNLVNLCGLYLRHCVKLKELPAEVGQLKQLEVLHLGDGTQINCLPREVGELSFLKRLIVGFISIYSSFDTKEGNYKKMRFPTGIIPNLSLLEEVGIYADNCSEKDQWDDGSMQAVIGELCKLERLSSLGFYFPNDKCLMHFVNERKLRKASCLSRFRFQVGPTKPMHMHRYGEFEKQENCLSYTYTGGDKISHGAIMETLTHCPLFQLVDHRNSQKLSEFSMTNMNGLRKCSIRGCEKMEVLFDGNEEQQTCAILPNLEELDIENLPNLRSLWVGPLSLGSLSKLTLLHLDSCEKMEFLFHRNAEQQTCAILPNLDELDIENLPNLRSLWVGPLSPGSLSKLTLLRLDSCEKMEFLFHGNAEEQTCAILPNLLLLDIENLPNLRSLWVGPLSPGSLSKLAMLNLNSCEKMEVLFYGNEEQQTCAILPNLAAINIKNLPNWRSLSVVPLSPGSLSKLTELNLDSCAKLEFLFYGNEGQQMCAILPNFVAIDIE